MDSTRRQQILDAAAHAYEAAHGNPIPEPPRTLRWRVTPRVAVTAVVVLGCVVAAGVLAARPQAAAWVPEPNPSPAVPFAIPAGTAEVTVHVAGAVAQPGVYVLETGARVADAVEAAGGATPESDTGAINLARLVVDGEQVYVPAVGEAGASDTARGLLNLNTADAVALEGLPGIGPVLAQRIVDDRAAHGSFLSVEDLQRVSGVGPKVMDALRDLVTV